MLKSFKTIGLVFSARKGNCLDFARYILNKNEVLHLSDYEISPCRNCIYECFNNKPCPINDDLSKIFKLLSQA